MEKLSITPNKRFDLQKYDNQLIASICSQYANTDEELNNLYELGVLKLSEYKNKLSTDEFDRFGFWYIKQEIIKTTTNAQHTPRYRRFIIGGLLGKSKKNR